jgi:hypothetical protein
MGGELIGVNKLREFFETIIYTARVKDGSPVSAMIIADPERGKTSICVQKECEAFKILTDVTGKGLQFLCQMDSRCTHFIVNDMGVITAHGQKTQNYFFSMLLAVTEEGIRAISSPDGFEAVQNGRRGFIGCITSAEARDKRFSWYRRGLARRMVPFHFDYPQNLVLKIKAEIDKDKAANFIAGDVLKIPDVNIKVDIPEKYVSIIRDIADRRAEILGQLGISLLKNYRMLAKAHALRRSNWKNVAIGDEDIEFLKRIDPYVDWTNPALL